MEGGDDALGIVLVGDLRHQPFGCLHDPRASGTCAARQGGQMGAVGHRGGDDQRLGFPALFKALFDQSGAFGKEQSGFAAPLLPFKTFQGLNKRV